MSNVEKAKQKVNDAIDAIADLNDRLTQILNSNPRPVPYQPLINNQISQTQSWCSWDPSRCFVTTITEALFIAAAYSTVVMALGGTPPNLSNIGMFLMLFTIMSYAARMVSDTLSDKMVITALSAISSKLLSSMIPKYVSW